VGSQVLTIEGLSKDGTHPVQMAWKALDVPQCGYCQSGQVLAASAAAVPTSASVRPSTWRPKLAKASDR